jgi:hypothetical protein
MNVTLKRSSVLPRVLLAATCAVSFVSNAAAEDPYTNPFGVTAGAGLTGLRRANATLNPNHVGQLLYGTFYDVRNVAEPTGSTDAQNVNLQILNTNPIGTDTGGVLARLRFRESKTGLEVAAFDIALSCAEVWTGTVVLQGSGATAVPAIKSIDPIVTSIDDNQLVTTPVLDPAKGGAPRGFSVLPPLTRDDVRRGYFEVIAEELLPCEPTTKFSRAGNTYLRIPRSDATPPNSLAGEVFLVRPLAGVSYNYTLPAISRFVTDGGGSIQSPVASGLPDTRSCVGFDNDTAETYTGFPDCRNQIDFALSKSRLVPQYDIEPSTTATTHLVLTLPTKHDHCTPGDTTPNPPFGCAANGEVVGCTIWDRLENRVTDSDAEPCHGPGTALLPREVTFVSVTQSTSASPRADVNFDTVDFDSGWIDIDLRGDPQLAGFPQHELLGFDRARVDVLGVGYAGFRGLPIFALVLQEYFNGHVGGVFGDCVEPPAQVDLVSCVCM